MALKPRYRKPGWSIPSRSAPCGTGAPSDARREQRAYLIWIRPLNRGFHAQYQRAAADRFTKSKRFSARFRNILIGSAPEADTFMKPKPRFSSRYGHVTPRLLPPDLRDFGSVAFTAHDFRVLDGWLAEEGWPAERMDAAMLEGYLVALLVWPIQLSPGAWLPAIWGVRGWKVAAKIAVPESYERFLALVIGMLQELERRLAATPPAPTFVLVDECALCSTRYFAGAAWSTGFISALQFNANGMGSRSASSEAAVEKILGFASLRSKEPGAMKAVASALRASVAVLMDERPARSAAALIPRGVSIATQLG